MAATGGGRTAAGWRRRLAPFLPWDGAGRWWPGWRAAPCVPAYLLVSWLLFVPAAERAPGNAVIDTERARPFLYAIPDLGDRLPRALASLVTAPWLNHNLVQLAYVTILLLGFGVPFEAREGSARTAAIFFGTTFAGAVAAGALLHALYPGVWDGPFAARAWERTWSGGSAGAFGLIGATAARARVPWPLLGLVVLWEANLVWWYLREYTPAFHLSALAAGFAVTRVALPPRDGAVGAAGRAAGYSGRRAGTAPPAVAERPGDGAAGGERGMDPSGAAGRPDPSGAAGRPDPSGAEGRTERDETAGRRHESVDHEHPTDAGLEDPDGGEVPGTGIMGDETLVRDADGEGVPGLYPAPAAHTGGAAHPGPTRSPTTEPERG